MCKEKNAATVLHDPDGYVLSVMLVSQLLYLTSDVYRLLPNEHKRDRDEKPILLCCIMSDENSNKRGLALTSFTLV